MWSRGWVALGGTLAIILVLTVAFGEEPEPCREAYLASHLSEQQLSFGEFRELYSDGACATSGPRRQEAGADRVNPQDGREDERFERKGLL